MDNEKEHLLVVLWCCEERKAWEYEPKPVVPTPPLTPNGKVPTKQTNERERNVVGFPATKEYNKKQIQREGEEGREKELCNSHLQRRCWM